MEVLTKCNNLRQSALEKNPFPSSSLIWWHQRIFLGSIEQFETSLPKWIEEKDFTHTNIHCIQRHDEPTYKAMIFHILHEWIYSPCHGYVMNTIPRWHEKSTTMHTLFCYASLIYHTVKKHYLYTAKWAFPIYQEWMTKNSWLLIGHSYWSSFHLIRNKIMTEELAVLGKCIDYFPAKV